MGIVSSTAYIDNHAQADGRHYVREEHADHVGKVHVVSYLADVGVDTNAVMLGRVPQIEQQLKAAELTELEGMVINGVDPFPNNESPTHNTQADWRRWILRRALSSADPVLLIRAVNMLDKFTDAQLRAILSITQIKVDEIRSKAVAIKNVKATLDAYVPPLTEV